MFKKLLLTGLLLAITSHAQEKGKELFLSKCSHCHVLEFPKDRSTMLGPPVKGVMYHMREEFNNDEDIEAHIQDFVLEPTLEKALCKSVRRFGLMPSQKDNVTKEELKIISEWMTKNFKITKEEYINSKKRH